MSTTHKKTVIHDLLAEDKIRYQFFIPTIEKFNEEQIVALFDGDLEFQFNNIQKPAFF